jgi:DNA-binding CsgD family transcriptional regulator
MQKKTDEILYRPHEKCSGIGILAAISVLTIVYIPNDIRYIGKELLFAAVLFFRGFCLSTTLVVWALSRRNLPDKTFNILVITMMACTGAISFFIECTRPRTLTFSGMPSVILMCYAFFALPAPTRIKILSGISVSCIEIGLLLFRKTGPFGDRISLVVSIAAITVLGVYNSISIGKLKNRERDFIRDIEDGNRFRNILSGDAECAVAVHLQGTIHGCNRQFLALAARCGIPEERTGTLDLFRFLNIEHTDVEAFNRGDRVISKVAGPGGSFPAEIRNRYFHENDKRFQAATIRLLPEESAEWNRFTDEEKAADMAKKLGLSVKDTAILRGLAAGTPENRIADDLCISDETLSKRTRAVFRKMGVDSKDRFFALLRA